MPSDAPNLFLGLDLYTQGLKAVLISEENQVVHESAVNFDRELPHFNTTNGAVKGPDEGEVTSPVKMWLEAFDLITEKMKSAGVNLGRVMAISGDGQVRLSLSAYSLRAHACAFDVATRLCLLVRRRRAPPIRSRSRQGPR